MFYRSSSMFPRPWRRRCASAQSLAATATWTPGTPRRTVNTPTSPRTSSPSPCPTTSITSQGSKFILYGADAYDVVRLFLQHQFIIDLTGTQRSYCLGSDRVLRQFYPKETFFNSICFISMLSFSRYKFEILEMQ